MVTKKSILTNIIRFNCEKNTHKLKLCEKSCYKTQKLNDNKTQKLNDNKTKKLE